MTAPTQEAAPLRVGIDLGGTKIAGTVLGAGGHPLAEHRMPAPRHDYGATVRAIGTMVRVLEESAGSPSRSQPMSVLRSPEVSQGHDLESPTWVTSFQGLPRTINVRRCRLEVVAGPDAGKIIEAGSPEEFFSNPKTGRAQQFLERYR